MGHAGDKTSTKVKIRAKDIVPDIRAGMNNASLMEKYELSSKGLLSIFTKLIDAGIIKSHELQDRIPGALDTVDLSQLRTTARCYPAMTLRIYDVNDLEGEYFVGDISTQGILVMGIECEPGDTKSFIIRGEQINSSDALQFDAGCRWTEKDPFIKAGFEIKIISDDDLIKLKELIQSTTLCEG